MDLWNTKDLKLPPVTSCKVISKEIDIRLLIITLTDAVEFFDNQQHFCAEAALLSRIVYRQKMKFRSSKDFKAVEKLSRVLRTYLQMQFSRSLKFLLYSIPSDFKVKKTFSLTKNMMDFVLVRIQGLSKILCRILETCKVISELTQQRFRLGHFWKIAAIIYSITARIFVIARSIFKYVCELYTNLLPYSSSLSNTGAQWLPENYVFPSRLEEWLEIGWLNLENNVIEIPDDGAEMSFFKLLEDSDDEVEFCDEYVLVKDEPSVCEIEDSDDDVQLCESPVMIPDEEDVGELVIVCDNDKTEEDEVDVGDFVITCDNKRGVKRKNIEEDDNVDLVITCDNTGNFRRSTKPKVNEKKKDDVDVDDLVIICDNTENCKINKRKKKRPKKRNNLSTSLMSMSDSSFSENAKNPRIDNSNLKKKRKKKKEKNRMPNNL